MDLDSPTLWSLVIGALPCALVTMVERANGLPKVTVRIYGSSYRDTYNVVFDALRTSSIRTRVHRLELHETRHAHLSCGPWSSVFVETMFPNLQELYVCANEGQREEVRHSLLAVTPSLREATFMNVVFRPTSNQLTLLVLGEIAGSHEWASLACDVYDLLAASRHTLINVDLRTKILPSAIGGGYLELPRLKRLRYENKWSLMSTTEGGDFFFWTLKYPCNAQVHISGSLVQTSMPHSLFFVFDNFKFNQHKVAIALAAMEDSKDLQCWGITVDFYASDSELSGLGDGGPEEWFDSKNARLSLRLNVIHPLGRNGAELLVFVSTLFAYVPSPNAAALSLACPPGLGIECHVPRTYSELRYLRLVNPVPSANPQNMVESWIFPCAGVRFPDFNVCLRFVVRVDCVGVDWNGWCAGNKYGYDGPVFEARCSQWRLRLPYNEDPHDDELTFLEAVGFISDGPNPYDTL